MSNNNPPASSQRTAATQFLSPGLTSAMLTQINSLSIKLGEAASPFLSIEALMRLLAELHSPYQGQVLELIKNAKTKPKFGPSDFFMGKAQDHRNESKSLS